MAWVDMARLFHFKAVLSRVTPTQAIASLCAHTKWSESSCESAHLPAGKHFEFSFQTLGKNECGTRLNKEISSLNWHRRCVAVHALTRERAKRFVQVGVKLENVRE